MFGCQSFKYLSNQMLTHYAVSKIYNQNMHIDIFYVTKHID